MKMSFSPMQEKDPEAVYIVEFKLIFITTKQTGQDIFQLAPILSNFKYFRNNI
jgi:hypothetical protein